MTADIEARVLSAIKLQSLARRYIARLRVIAIILKRTEKIWDPRRHEFYYYDIVTDRSSWRKPRALRNVEISDVAPTYQSDEASMMIVRQCRRRAALRKVRMLYQSVVVATYDESFAATYYYNPITGNTSWELPLFMNGKLDYAYDKLPLGGTKADIAESSSESEDSDLSIDSEIARQRRRAKRKFPRSKVQKSVDYVEDNIQNGIASLDLRNINISNRLTDRIWDFTQLQVLNISHNSISKISSKIQYLIKLQELDISYNKLSKIPKKIEDLTQLKTFNAKHNNFSSFTGYLYKCSRLESVDFSFNNFINLPIVEGNLELLKATKQWDVGIGVLKNLRYLNMEGNKLVHWPEQLDRNVKLQELILRQNFITAVPNVVEKNTALTSLDLSNNLLHTLPTEIYYLPIKRLILNNNCLEDLPILVLPKSTDGTITNHGKSGLSGIKMSSIVEVNLAFNKLSRLDFRIGLFEKVRKFCANDNCITEIHENVGLLKVAKEINLARNKISGASMISLGLCEALSKLDISCNCVDRIPESFSTLRSLTELNASDNAIGWLPDRLFASLTNMQNLNFRNNQIETLPMSFYAMRKISFLDLSYNQIAQAIPKQIEQLTLLNTLILSHNLITELPPSISALTLLQVLEVDFNRLTRFPSSISRLRRLCRVTTSGNIIEIKPHALADLPNLMSWDMGWNTIMVGNYVDWAQKEARYRKDVDVMSVSFLRRLLRRANGMIGLSDESKNIAHIHIIQADSSLLSADGGTFGDDSSAETKSEKKKSKKAQKLEDERRRLAEERENVIHAKNKEQLEQLMKWHRRLKRHFEVHLGEFAAPVYARNQDAALQTLDDKTHAVTKRRTSMQLLSLMRNMHCTSQQFRNPMLVLREIEEQVPVSNVLEGMDLGHRFQSAIELFEYIACEIHAKAEIIRTEQKIVDLKWAEERRLTSSSSLKTTPLLSQHMSLSCNAEVASEIGSARQHETSNAFQSSSLTSRSQFDAYTARTNTSDGQALLNLALGDEPLTGRFTARTTADKQVTNAENPSVAVQEGPTLVDPTIHVVAVTLNEVTLEQECDKKNLLVNFDAPPSILHHPFLGAIKSDMYMAAFDCYFGLGVAILFRVDKLSAAIRNIEIRGGLVTSCLDIAQRSGEDYRDFVEDVYNDTLELLKKKEENLKGSLMEQKKKKMSAFLNASGAQTMEIEESKEDPDQEEEVKPGDKKAKKKVTKKKIVVGPVVDDSEVEAKMRRERVSAIGNTKVIGNELRAKDAIDAASFLFEHRKLLGLWANKAFDTAAEMLSLLGWQTAEELQESISTAKAKSVSSAQVPESFRHQAMNLHFYRAKALQSCHMYDKCLIEYNTLLFLCRGKFHRAAKLEVLKVTLAKSDFVSAKRLIHEYIEHEVDHADIKFPEPHELLREHYALALLLMFTNCGVEQLKTLGYCRPEHSLTFLINSNGIFEKPKPIKESDKWKVRNHAQDEYHFNAKKEDAVEAQELYKKEVASEEMKVMISEARSKYRSQLDFARADMEEAEKRTAELIKMSEAKPSS